MIYHDCREVKTIKNIKEIEALKKVQILAKKLRKQNNKKTHDKDYTIPIGYAERIGHLDHKPVKRIIIYLRSSGCKWIEKSGGCTMCGFYRVTSHGRKISEHEYISQFESVLDEVDLNDYPIVCIYNDGNFFNENEISINTIKKIFSLITRYRNVKKIFVESRIEYISEDKIRKVKESMRGKDLEIGFGFESSNELIMNLCINKGFPFERLDSFFDRMRNLGVSIKPLLLLKPPFLTEAESIDDALSTIDYLFSKGIDYIDLEITTVQRYTVVHELWKKNLYRPPWLWSIIDILLKCKERYNERVHLYISPWEYSVVTIDNVRNCGKCDEEVKKRIDLYNYNFDVTVFKDLDCSCKDEWMHVIKEINELDIPERITNQLETI